LPPAIGHNGNSRLADLKDVLDPLLALDFGGIETHQLAAEHGTVPDRGAEHPGQLHVQTVNMLAGDLGRGVEPLEWLAGDLPILRILQYHVLWWLDLGSRFGDVAECLSAARGLVCDHTVRCAALRRRNLPFARRSLDQHGSCDGTGLPDIFV